MSILKSNIPVQVADITTVVTPQIVQAIPINYIDWFQSLPQAFQQYFTTQQKGSDQNMSTIQSTSKQDIQRRAQGTKRAELLQEMRPALEQAVNTMSIGSNIRTDKMSNEALLGLGTSLSNQWNTVMTASNPGASLVGFTTGALGGHAAIKINDGAGSPLDPKAAQVIGNVLGGFAGARRASVFMPNLRASVYNRVNPYGYGGHAKELGQLTGDNLLYTGLLGKRIKPLSYFDKMDKIDMTPFSVENVSRDIFLRDRVGIPFDITTYQNSPKGLISSTGRNYLHSELPYILDATANDGSNIYHFNTQYLASPFGTKKLTTIRPTILPRRNVDVLTGAGGRVGARLKDGQFHLYDRWNTKLFEHPNKQPLWVARLINNSQFAKQYIYPLIKNFDPIEMISVRPAPIQYNVMPIGLSDAASFEAASSRYNILNADNISTTIHKSGGTIKIKKKNRGSFTRYCNGKVTEECIRKGKNSSNPTTRKRANFAWVARHKFKHEEGGKINYLNIF